MTSLESSDPRLTDEYLRRSPGRSGAGSVLIVGVVHDHPASAFRVARVVEREQPDTLALELPPMAVPLFERYADDDRSPPPFGGEMSAAIQAATDATVVGIDGPSAAFVRRLCSSLYRERADTSTVGSVLANLASVTRNAVTCRLAAAVAATTSIRLEVDSPQSHPTDRTDDPAVQARDEVAQVERARTVLNALDPPRASQFATETRDRHMAARIGRLREAGDVVAVVGMDHLDSVADRLAGTAAEPRTRGRD